ncbi:MAG TPA: hypothetical protein VH257_16550, partial [Chloroflexota bacterium]|nr:hypothetical protein [Chloroflexota bacterium]
MAVLVLAGAALAFSDFPDGIEAGSSIFTVTASHRAAVSGSGRTPDGSQRTGVLGSGDPGSGDPGVEGESATGVGVRGSGVVRVRSPDGAGGRVLARGEDAPEPGL